jgi:HSP20 family protein
MLLYPTRPFGRDPFAAMRQLQSEIERSFAPISSQSSRATFPAVNMWQGEQSVAVSTELPGVSPDDIEISVKDDLLTLTGERKAPDVGDKAVWHRRERTFGKFARSIQLPFRVDAKKVEARFQDGVLEIEMQRPEEDKPRRIKVKAA